MSDDIVERLRSRADAHHHGDRIGSGNLMGEAADEIERLRKEVEQWRENDKMQREILTGAVP